MAQQLLDSKQNIKKGFVTLLSVLILGAVGVVVVTNYLLINAENIIGIATIEESKQAKALVDTCAEYAINTLKTNLNYLGNETLSLSFGSCTISTISGTGNTSRSFQVTSTYLDQTRKLNIVISVVNPITSITTWQEIQ